MAAADPPRRPGPPTGGPDAAPSRRGLVDFRELGGRLWLATGVLGALALGACIVDALLNGLTFALMARWAAAFLATMIVVAGVLVAVHAAGGARRARARGERLSSDGTGLLPPRRREP
ncbi:MAG TPA: hypothetical protein VIK95_04010 [Egibacteraceae bacterium]